MKTFKNDLSEHDLKSISILQKTCKIDFENSVVEMPLHFSSVKEIIDSSTSDDTNISVTTFFINELKNKIANVPSKFYLNLLLTFDSANGFSYEKIMDALQEKMEEQYNTSSQNKKTTCYKVIAYVIVCVIVSLIKTLPITVDYTAGISDTYANILQILINSIASLFLCQATWTIFDMVVRRKKDDGALFKRINKITITGHKNDIYTRDSDELFKYWPYKKNSEKFAYGVMLLGSGYVMTICVIEFILFVTGQISLNNVDTYLFIIQWIFILFIVQVNTAVYFGKGELSRYALNISILYFVVLTIYNATRLIFEHVSDIPFDSDNFLFVYQILSFLNIICVKIINKERNIRKQHIEQLVSNK